MDLGAAKDILTVLSMGLSVIAILYGAVAARSKATQGQIQALHDKAELQETNAAREIQGVHDRIERLDLRFTKVETEMSHLPNAAGFHRMELTMTRLQGDMEVLTERLKPIAAVGERLQEFLLDQASTRR